MAFFQSLTYWHWLILGVALIGVEMIAPGFVFLWLGIAAGVTGVGVLAVPELGWEIQVLLFAALALVSVFFGRRYVSNKARPTDQPALNRRGQGYVGRSYTLAQPVSNGIGRLVIDDTNWAISGPDAASGTRVRVVGMDDMVLIVEPTDQ